MPILAITSELGSLGDEIARGLSDACAVPYVHAALAERIAERMQVDTRRVERLADGSAGWLERLTADTASLSIFAADEVLAIAARERGAVINGWGATHLLRAIPHAIRVRVCAPLEVRRRRILEPWTDPEHYDLVLNTERMGVRECIDQVYGLVKSPAFAETPESRRRLRDLALGWRVRAELRSAPRTRGLRITVTAQGGLVVLSGIVDRMRERVAACEVAARAARDYEVLDRLRAVESLRPHFV